MPKFDYTPWKRLLERAVKALETIAEKSGSNTTQHDQHVPSPVSSSAEEVYKRTQELLSEASFISRIPAYFMPKNGSVVFDEDPSNGFAIIDDSGITIKLPPEHYPDYVREMLGRKDVDVVAITVGINGRENSP